MFSILPLALLLPFTYTTNALPYDPQQIDYNLNQNTTATNPLDYWGSWDNHQYQPSPKNWRFPFYTIFLDRFVNGDPTNDNANGTVYEHDILSNQFRNGGDVKGLMDTLDYLQGMGIKGIYLAGSLHINQPWAADSYSPLDLTLLDYHFGNITAWRAAVTEIHARGMYVILDNTMSTLGDLIGFDDYLNTSAPFSFTEHRGIYKSSRQYHDFDIRDGIIPIGSEDCTYPRFWTPDGDMTGSNVTEHMVSCLTSDFDQYGDVASFGTYPEWQKQLSKFGFVQDRLREWRPSVLERIKRFSCITIAMLDIDGFRMDKALTITVDAQAEWSDYIRQCARDHNKKNFFIPGEIVGANTLGAIYLGRGKEPQMALPTLDEAIAQTNATNPEYYIRGNTRSALDGAAFHYSIYRSLCRFLGIDGLYAALSDTPVNWVDAWQEIVRTNDLVNTNTGSFDPRHMYGVVNQDVFRWPALTNGVEKNLVGLYITTLLLPGIPTLMWGEEQASYVLENTANNYLFGRAPMTSSLAWQMHGCYTLGAEKYYNLPLDSALHGCHDDSISLDHRDPSHPVRVILKRMYELRAIYPTLNDGYNLNRLSNKTFDVYLPGSYGTPTETGMWSVLRSQSNAQDLSGSGQGNQSVWLIYGNENKTTTYTFDCATVNQSLLAPFAPGTVVKNLFYPYEEQTLIASAQILGLGGLAGVNGCLKTIQLPAWGYKAFVPKAKWVGAAPTITKFLPGHDTRILSTVPAGQKETVPITIGFSLGMDCSSVTKSINIESNTDDNSNPTIDLGTVQCAPVTGDVPAYSGGLASLWTWSANLVNVGNGVHAVVVRNASGTNGTTNAVDRFMFRIGQPNNPMIFPKTANYSNTLLQRNPDGSLYIAHQAAGATLFRYSRDWGSHFSQWQTYTGGNTPLAPLNWTGTPMQAWSGEHVQVEYWSNLTASANHYQHGDLGGPSTPRRLPHMYVQGPFNQFSFDNGLPGTMNQLANGTWVYDFMTEWPSSFQLNEWGVNPDGQPDQTLILGDVDGDFVLDRLPPGSLLSNVINITESPPSPYTGFTIAFDDGTLHYYLLPVGNRWRQLILYCLLASVPVLTAAATVWIFMKTFYQIKFNKVGISTKHALIPLAVRRKFKKPVNEKSMALLPESTRSSAENSDPLHADLGGARRSVLLASLEYNIDDWGIKIKIGGLGVMAQLMSQNLGHLDLIWVVPCVRDVEYPIDTPVESMFISILGKEYEVQVQYHKLRNVTYVLLDAPIFRKQSKSEPYPARMDDLESAIYYSAWNQCIAQAIDRFNPNLYHINDYHGALAPLHLLPKVYPCCLSLHNAEFQGLWPMRTPKERDEVCNVFNIDPGVAQKYVQFGEVFNLLHAGASYLRIHQKGFGAVGVSKKYGKRTFARYPIFWGLSKIGSLPNPDPTDTGEWERDAVDEKGDVMINQEFESKRPALKRQAQNWAGLQERPDAELFVFVGRWSQQKGIDLIADVFPSVLESNPKVQLICVGPVIDLYGRFAALKLEKMMQLYPGRVYSKPEFTALPPYIFSGSEFALIPSRDEPFGLVAVEFGRKGALGVGAKVGGLGQMPGWWYSVESVTAKHLVHQFKSAISEALSSSTKTRSMMRARSALQRFPVAQWVEDLDTLQVTSIRLSREENSNLKSPSMANLRTLFVGGHSNHSLHDLPPSRHGSTLVVPGTPTVPGQWTPPVIHMPTPSSPGLTPISGSAPGSPHDDEILLPPSIFMPSGPRDSLSSRRFSTLSYDSVAGERTDFALQKVDPNFTDANGVYSRAFKEKLEKLKGKSSESELCIEEYLMKSEKAYFNTYRDAKMGFSTPSGSRAPSIMGGSRPGTPTMRPSTPVGSFFEHSTHDSVGSNGSQTLLNSEFPLGADYKPPTGFKRLVLYRVGDWPIYSILLAFGQIIAANSYQITLLIGEIGETALQLYIIATIYAISSMLWWLVFRRFKAIYVLSLPFVFYGTAFMMIGVAPFFSDVTRGWIQNTATGVYAVASASGSFYFALNFGDEGGAPVKTWVWRACLVQGTQQLYISALWYWGASLVKLSTLGIAITTSVIPNRIITAITIPIAALMWSVGIILFIGLPKFYHAAPGKVPSFYKSIFRRKIILWFFVGVIIQNYWLSAPYGRNWRYLWTTQHAPPWAIMCLVIGFFIIIWTLFLLVFSKLSKSHSWILPVFAIGLGAPRWCQMLWGTSAMGSYLPWAGSAILSAILGRALWLWLGVLDALQGVGFGMILLQTMTRFHICFTLVAAQVLGSIATILARLTAPDNTGPGPVFPNFALSADGLGTASFWLGLLMQLVICVGFALFFRKEQLSKP